MLYQLPSGRTIEISVEQYLSMTNEDLSELDCLSSSYTMELNNPFYKPYNGIGKQESCKVKLNDEHNLVDMPEEIKRDDKDFHNKDDI